MEQTAGKKSTTKNLTEGSPWKLILLFSLPLMAGNIFQQMYTVVDTAIVGKVLGVEALAALGAVDWLNWLVLGAIQGFTQGFAIMMAQKFGAGEYRRLRQVVANSILLSVLCALVLTAGSQGLARWAMQILQTPEEIQPLSLAYLRILFAGIPVVTAYNLAASILRALGDGKTPLTAMIIASITNIVLDLLFVMGFGWGVQGAAAATIIAQCLSAVYCFIYIRRIEVLHMEKEAWKMEGALCGNLMKLGAPMAFQNAVIAVGGMIVQSIVNGIGVTFLAGFTATNKLYGLLEVAGTSYGFAMTTYCGQNLGAGRLDRVSKGTRAGMIIGTCTSMLIGICMLAFGKPILSCFISAESAQSDAALAIAYQYLSLMAVCLPILYVIHIMRSSIQGLGNTVLPMVSGISEFVMRLLSAMFLPVLFGDNGIMFAEILAWIGADVILVPSYFYVMKKILSARAGSGEQTGKER